MGRPSKYATAKEAAEANLYSKMGGKDSGLSLPDFVSISTSRCTLCTCKPSDLLEVDRADETYTLYFNRVVIVDGKHYSVCRQCKVLLSVSDDMRSIIRLAARLMARRKWCIDNNTFIQGLEKPTVE